jgi:hypothetical protein
MAFNFFLFFWLGGKLSLVASYDCLEVDDEVDTLHVQENGITY